MSLLPVEIEMIELMLKRANTAQVERFRMLLSQQTKMPTGSASSKEGPLRVGDRVIFTGRKTKPPVIGTIKSMNAKTYTIENCSDGGPGWRMPPAMLQRYTGA